MRPIVLMAISDFEIYFVGLLFTDDFRFGSYADIGITPFCYKPIKSTPTIPLRY